MIKIFNKMRKQLLEENKTGRYLKYAIGEIVLVMIGILLALQVNNWNTNRELKKEEQKVMNSLHQEFSQNLEKFDAVYKFHLNRKKSIETIMSIEPKNMSLDSLLSLRAGVGANYTFDPYQGIYNSIINSGKIELFSNDILKQRISKFQDLLSDYQEEETGTMRFVQNNLYPFVINNQKRNFNIVHNIKQTTEAEKITHKKDMIKLIESDTFENILTYIYGYMQDTFIEGPILRVEMVSIINLLESEIKKHEN